MQKIASKQFCEKNWESDYGYITFVLLLQHLGRDEQVVLGFRRSFNQEI
jgi:hypothetical protein